MKNVLGGSSTKPSVTAAVRSPTFNTSCSPRNSISRRKKQTCVGVACCRVGRGCSRTSGGDVRKAIVDRQNCACTAYSNVTIVTICQCSRRSTPSTITSPIGSRGSACTTIQISDRKIACYICVEVNCTKSDCLPCDRQIIMRSCY